MRLKRLKAFFGRLRDTWPPGRRWRTLTTAEEPDALLPNVIYLVGGQEQWAAAFLCPCGCKKSVWLKPAQGPPTPLVGVGERQRPSHRITLGQPPGRLPEPLFPEVRPHCMVRPQRHNGNGMAGAFHKIGAIANVLRNHEKRVP